LNSEMIEFFKAKGKFIDEEKDERDFVYIMKKL
jgi:hypothetical protein